MCTHLSCASLGLLAVHVQFTVVSLDAVVKFGRADLTECNFLANCFVSLFSISEVFKKRYVKKASNFDILRQRLFDLLQKKI